MKSKIDVHVDKNENEITIGELAIMISHGFDAVNARIDNLQGSVDRRFNVVDRRFDSMDIRFDTLEHITQTNAVRHRALEETIQ